MLGPRGLVQRRATPVTFKTVLDAKPAWHDVLIGGLVTALLFSIGRTDAALGALAWRLHREAAVLESTAHFSLRQARSEARRRAAVSWAVSFRPAVHATVRQIASG